VATDSSTSLQRRPAASDYLGELANAAIRYVKSGQTIGLGTGRAAQAFIRALATARIDIQGVPTSSASAKLARSLRIPLVTLDQVGRLDADFDGADEVDPHLDMIKGRGGALLREKVVALASRRRIFLVGHEKLVKRLGERANLPVEVVPFAVPLALREIARLGLKPKVRLDGDGSQFTTDNGNLVLDCGVGIIRSPARLESKLRGVPGVVGTGLFLGIADIILVMSDDRRLITLRRSRS